MIPKTLRRFIYQLIEATDEKSIRWSTGAPDAYFCAHKGLNLHISYFFNSDDGVGYYNFRITGEGKDAAFAVNSNEVSDYNDMNNLYSSISVNASNIEDDLKDFFD